MLGSEPIEYRDDLGTGKVGNRDGLVKGTGIAVETAPVDIDQDLSLLIRRNTVGRSNHPNRDPSDLRRGDIHRIDGAVCLGSGGCCGVGLCASLSESLVGVGIRNLVSQSFLSLGADGGRQRNDAGDVRRAIDVNVTGILLRGGVLARLPRKRGMQEKTENSTNDSNYA